MAPFPVRKLVARTGKKCLKVLKKLAFTLSQNEPTCSTEQLPSVPEDRLIASFPSAESFAPCVVLSNQECKIGSTTVTWLDDIRDLEDMENRLNEALEQKMRTSSLCSS